MAKINPSKSRKSSETPLSKCLTVLVSMPATIETKMVDASVLSDYEVWSFSTSILASSIVGFLVAYLQNNQNNSFLAMTLILAVLFVISLVMALTKRHKIRSKSKVIKLQASEIAG